MMIMNVIAVYVIAVFLMTGFGRVNTQSLMLDESSKVSQDLNDYQDVIKKVDAFSGDRKRCGRMYTHSIQDQEDYFDCPHPVERTKHKHKNKKPSASFIKREKSGSSRLFFAKPALITQFPSYVRMKIWQGENVYHCGGVLLHNDLILTSAACATISEKVDSFKYRNITNIDLAFGYGEAEDTEAVHVKVSSKNLCIAPFKGYFLKDQKRLNNLATIVLDKPLEYSDRISPTCVRLKKQVNEDLKCYAIGFGSIDGVGNEPTQLQMLAVSNKTCKYDLHKDEREDLTCWRSLYMGTACYGDFGGGVHCFDKCKGRPTSWLLGTMSYAVLGRNGVCWDDADNYVTDTDKAMFEMLNLVKQCYKHVKNGKSSPGSSTTTTSAPTSKRPARSKKTKKSHHHRHPPIEYYAM